MSVTQSTTQLGCFCQSTKNLKLDVNCITHSTRIRHLQYSNLFFCSGLSFQVVFLNCSFSLRLRWELRWRSRTAYEWDPKTNVTHSMKFLSTYNKNWWKKLLWKKFWTKCLTRPMTRTGKKKPFFDEKIKNEWDRTTFLSPYNAQPVQPDRALANDRFSMKR